MPDTRQMPRWRTTGGAIVQLFEHTHHGENGYAWECDGCDARGSWSRWFNPEEAPTFKSAAEKSAAEHAESCRALPR